MHNLQEHK